MGGGGKGGGSTTVQEIPKWIEEPAKRNLARAEDIQKMGYQPYIGIDVAAQTPQTLAANQMGIGAAEAFGMVQPNTLSATTGLPKTYEVDGVRGYSSAPLYEQAVSAARTRDPRGAKAYDALFPASNAPRRFGGTTSGGVKGGGNVEQSSYMPTQVDPSKW